MTSITITESINNESNLLYIQSSVSELLSQACCRVERDLTNGRAVLKIGYSECYSDVIKIEIADKIAEIIAIKYKYEFFKKIITLGGLSAVEKEILFASLIAADLDDDKRFAFEKIKGQSDVAIDGVYNFRLKLLKKKWQDVATYIPTCFLSSQLKDFISYLIENKKKRTYIDDGRVYDCHYRRLKRSSLLDGDTAKIVREVLLSNCGEVELSGAIPKEDEYYLKEYYTDKIIFSSGIVE